MTFARRIAPFILPIAVLVAGWGNGIPVPRPTQTQAASGVNRYTSTAYGYALLIPSSLVRIPAVHWTPAGPPADLTVLTPDHQAALGVLVVPTGKTSYSDDQLQAVAIRLLYQENLILSGTPMQAQRVVINNVPFEMVSVYRVSGSPTMGTISTVAVAQQHHRLYAIATVVYNKIASLPPPGAYTPTPTPTGAAGLGLAPNQMRPAAVATVVPAAGMVRIAGSVGPRGLAGAVHPAGMQRIPVAAPPTPLPTDHLRGNKCPALADAGLIVIDKNCAYPAERQIVQSMQASFMINPHAPDDRRPAATIGLDGFAIYTDPSEGFTVAVPAQWTLLSLQGTLLAVRSPDQNALDVVQVQTTSNAAPSQDDLQSVASADIAEVGTSLPSSITYRATHINGALVVLATTPLVRINKANFNLASARASVMVAAYRHRIYSVLGATVMTQTGGDSTPVIYPFFGAFTDLARFYQVVLDTHLQEDGLASQAVLSLVIDPHVAAPK